MGLGKQGKHLVIYYYKEYGNSVNAQVVLCPG